MAASRSEFARCEREENREKSQLITCNQGLQQRIKELLPDWSPEAQPAKQLLESLETRPHIASTATALYEKYYSVDGASLKATIQNSEAPLHPSEVRFIKAIKEASVKVYENTKTRVYQTEEIPFNTYGRGKGAKKRLEAVTTNVAHGEQEDRDHRERSDVYDREIITRSSRPGSRNNNHEEVLNEIMGLEDDEEIDERIALSFSSTQK